MLSVKNRLGGGGVKVTIDGNEIIGELNLQKKNWLVEETIIPNEFSDGSVAVLSDTLHLLGSSYSSALNSKWQEYKDGVWTIVTGGTPYACQKSCAVTYNNEIHLMGGDGTDSQKHYKFNGTSWSSVGTIPFPARSSKAVVYNNQIHLLGSSYNSPYYTYHYKWNGSSWTKASTLPYSFYNGGDAVVYDGKIYIIGGYGVNSKNFYSWDGVNWTSLGKLPMNEGVSSVYGFQDGSAAVYDNKIYCFGGCYFQTATKESAKNVWTWDGSEWKQQDDMMNYFHDGEAILYNGGIHLLGGGSTSKYNMNSKFITGYQEVM